MFSFERFEGCLLGLACGDAIGAAVEFYPRGRFTPLTGMRGGGKFQLRPGEWTDDTSMALCLAESLLACDGFDAQDQMQRYWRWADKGHWSSRPYAFGLGKVVAGSLRRFYQTGNPYSGPTEPPTSGNGSLMRIAPIPMFYARDREAAVEHAALSSMTTHASEDCLVSCRWFTALVWSALNGETDKARLLSSADDIMLPPSMQDIKQGRYRHATQEGYDGSGYVVKTLEAALWAFWNSSSFDEAVLMAANLGGDADTTAAVCGQLAGAFYGTMGIPADWLKCLAMREEISGMAMALHSRHAPIRLNATEN